MSFVKPVNRVTYPSDRQGFFYALSSRETSSDLNQPDNSPINIKRQEVHNQPGNRGYIGYFQVGESALYDAGFFTIPYKFSTDKKSSFQKAITNNDWVGSWTGKDGVNSKADYLRGRRHQLTAINILVNKNCGYIRNDNVNEFYGKKMNGVELTESGCIAASHLVGFGSLKKYALSNGKTNIKDGNNTSVQDYMDLLNYYDMESCCNRKIYLTVKDNNSPVSGIAVQVESEYKAGKYYSKVGKIKNTYTTNEDGKIPVIVRHPGAVIKVTVNGKTQTIIQKADRTQNYTIDITDSIKATGRLDKSDTPQPRPVPNKSPQDQRNELKSESSVQSANKEPKDVTFNITIVEGDTKKPITNLRYYLIYKGQSKEHRTDNQGIESNITAEVGQDIEICVAGDKKLQAVAHFKVNSSHQGKTIRALLPVEAFNIEIKDYNKQPVKNTKFIIYYRGREIVKQTNSQGLISVKMLVGFVYKFGLVGGKPLATLRCIKGAKTQPININEAAKNKAQGVSRPTTTTTKNPSPQPKPENNPPPTKPTATKPKPKPVTEESHTATNGRPITTVITDKAASDTTRYHIYYNGKIKRQNGNATGYAEFIYYDENGGKHNLGKSAYIPVSRLKAGNVVIDGDVYLVNQQKHESYKNGNIGYRWKIESDSKRYYLNGITLAATLGAMMSYGYEKYVGTGWSNVKGQSVAPSKTHRNGEAGDFRYLGKKGEHVTVPVHTTYSSFDMDANTRLVKHFKRFKFQAFYTGTKASGGVAKIPGTSWAPNHHHHLHVGGHSYEVEDI
ncbi:MULTISPECIES: hypothetical protein [unclassified Psychrobacter]|uniref:hypothetical protein n=1 Tax=unclassified Psychrobacter TaxID=196806 RepID=UPI003F9E7B1A